MDISKTVVIIGWFSVFMGWFFTVILRVDKSNIKRIVVNSWKCRLVGITNFIAFLIIVFNFGAIGMSGINNVFLLPAWLLFFGGVFIYWWARVKLGKSWSSIAKVSDSHKLVLGGPYRFVRHPIYFAHILMPLGSSIILLNVALFFASFPILLFSIYQAKIEEEMLVKFYPEYKDYAKKVRMIIPFLR